MYKWQNIQKRISHIKNPVGAEIGVYRGEMSRRLLDNIPGLTLYMIDLWSPTAYEGKGDESASEEMRREYQENADSNMITACVNVDIFGIGKRAIILRDESTNVAKKFNDRFFDFVYIDADHSYEGVKADIIAWLPKVKKSGWLCGHDYGYFPGVKKAVDEYFGDKNYKFGEEEIDLSCIETPGDYTWFVKC